MQPEDIRRAWQLAAYLAEFHQVKHDDDLWWQRLRDLVEHVEDIMGLTNSYPTGLNYAPAAQLRQLEEAANQ